MRRLTIALITVIGIALLAGLLGCGEKAAPTITTASPLPTGEVGSAYSETLGASGGSGTYTTWSITAGTLPDGLSLDSPTGLISGTPTTAGTTTITVQVTDSKGRPATEDLSITIAVAPTITTASPLPTGEVGIAYLEILEVSGGSGTYTNWSITAGTLPDGLSLVASFGVILGTPTTAGTTTITVQVTDNLGGTGTKDLSITIAAPPTIITASPLPTSEVGVAYSETLEASSGSGTYSNWSITSGTLPDGLSLGSSTGVISGIPTTAGTTTITVQVTDSLGGTATKDLSITIAAAPTITTASPLPTGEVNIAYSETLEASSGSGTYTNWSITAGTLPDGLSLDSSTGVISGIPTTAGTTTITVQVTDSLDGTATKDLSVTIS
jgi:large repetitive protein